MKRKITKLCFSLDKPKAHSQLTIIAELTAIEFTHLFVGFLQKSFNQEVLHG